MTVTLRTLMANTLGVLGLLFLTLSQASAQFVIIDGEGFESPAYSTTFLGTGQLEGQIASTTGGLLTEQWFQAGGAGTAFVQDAVVASGDQAVQVNRVAGSNDFWGVPVDGFPTEPIVKIEFDMRVDQTISTGFGPFFGVSAFDDASGIGLLGSLGVDASTGDVLVQEGGTGVLIETGATVGFNIFNSFELILNFDTDTSRAFVNGVLVSETGFVDPGLDNFSDASLTAVAAAGGPSGDLEGTAYFDNYLVTEIPEPTALLLLASAMATPLLARRR